jgi:phosphatidate cytidylyltransferase
MAGAEAQAKRSDLSVRAVSAIVMVAVAGAAWWFGGWFWIGFVVLIAAGVFWEWRGIVGRFVRSAPAVGLWNAAGLVYVGGGAATLVFLRESEMFLGPSEGLLSGLDLFGEVLQIIVLAVIATDIGAYFVGRAIGGPKIAPKISPSKTWAGLFGGVIGATLAVLFFSLRSSGYHWDAEEWLTIPLACLLTGTLCAVVAQAGDFFESWMKRRAGVKDSGHLLPGHGGLFDRVDGLLAVSFLFGLYMIVAYAIEGP